mmetsp:Transcript_29553/g.55287  ORF Transcript_29553/g.55287 Transcript_29553/m.55287 type:complete len:419 (-) Transcript_29553:359-1615(-)
MGQLNCSQQNRDLLPKHPGADEDENDSKGSVDSPKYAPLSLGEISGNSFATATWERVRTLLLASGYGSAISEIAIKAKYLGKEQEFKEDLSKNQATDFKGEQKLKPETITYSDIMALVDARISDLAQATDIDSQNAKDKSKDILSWNEKVHSVPLEDLKTKAEGLSNSSDVLPIFLKYKQMVGAMKELDDGCTKAIAAFAASCTKLRCFEELSEEFKTLESVDEVPLEPFRLQLAKSFIAVRELLINCEACIARIRKRTNLLEQLKSTSKELRKLLQGAMMKTAGFVSDLKLTASRQSISVSSGPAVGTDVTLELVEAQSAIQNLINAQGGLERVFREARVSQQSYEEFLENALMCVSRLSFWNLHQRMEKIEAGLDMDDEDTPSFKQYAASRKLSDSLSDFCDLVDRGKTSLSKHTP